MIYRVFGYSDKRRIKLFCLVTGTHIFVNTSLNDTEIGVILLLAALLVICGSLVLLVKILSGMLKGSVAKVIKKTINFDLGFPFSWVTGYLALLIGAGMTVIVQSSSVFTAILTPLVGVGVITIERMYPLTLGSNLGTTGTSVLAALASPPETFSVSLQTALIHLFFNLTGVVLWYPVPFLRNIPISVAKLLGNTTAKYRWFAVVYIFVVFLLAPGFVFLLSWLGWQYLAGIGGPIFVVILLVIIINVLQRKMPKILPVPLRTWAWLPRCMRSFGPMDNGMKRMLHAMPCCRNLSTDVSPPRRPVNLLDQQKETTFSKHQEKDPTNIKDEVVPGSVTLGKEMTE